MSEKNQIFFDPNNLLDFIEQSKKEIEENYNVKVLKIDLYMPKDDSYDGYIIEVMPNELIFTDIQFFDYVFDINFKTNTIRGLIKCIHIRCIRDKWLDSLNGPI